jgi:hypothetical protein
MPFPPWTAPIVRLYAGSWNPPLTASTIHLCPAASPWNEPVPFYNGRLRQCSKKVMHYWPDGPFYEKNSKLPPLSTVTGTL